MQRRRGWREKCTGSMAVFLLAGGFQIALANEPDVPDVDPAGVSDPVERKFYQELHELREKQKRQRQELASQDLTPQERLDKRRDMLLIDHKEIQQLDSAYQTRLSPEARSRWVERKANRQKRFDRLERGGDPASTKPAESGKSRKKNQK